jgi:hypothetical protein
MERIKMERKSILVKARERLAITLILFELVLRFELVLSVIFILVGYLTGNMYFRGVGVGLIIAWVISALAYFRVKQLQEGK